MNTFINDEEVCTNLVKNEAQFSNNQKVNETVAKDPSYGSDFLGGQNDIALFCDLAKNIKFGIIPSMTSCSTRACRPTGESTARAPSPRTRP